MKKLNELIDTKEPGWELVESWLDEAKNQVEVLPCSKEDGEKALYEIQVTTRSPMGAIVYQTGGLLVDHGWIRIFGAGCKRLPISLPAWNLGKTLKKYGEQAPFLVIADDVLGGLFALNGGQFGRDLGKVYYFPMDSLEWETTELGYSEFLWWSLVGDLNTFYEGFRWQGWKKDAAQLPGDQVFSFYPFLSSSDEKIENLHRENIPVNESYSMFVGYDCNQR